MGSDSRTAQNTMGFLVSLSISAVREQMLGRFSMSPEHVGLDWPPFGLGGPGVSVLRDTLPHVSMSLGKKTQRQ